MITSALVLALLLSLIGWGRTALRLNKTKRWILGEQHADQDLLDEDPKLAAELGIKRKVDEKVIEYRSNLPQLTPMQTNLERIWQQQALEQQASRQASLAQQQGMQQSPLGNLLGGGLGGGPFSSMWIKGKE